MSNSKHRQEIIDELVPAVRKTWSVTAYDFLKLFDEEPDNHTKLQGTLDYLDMYGHISHERVEELFDRIGYDTIMEVLEEELTLG